MSQQRKSNPTEIKRKNIFPFLKHLAKDPVKSLEEADARLKAIKKMRYICLILALAPFALILVIGAIIPNYPEFIATIFGVIAFIGIAGVLYSWLLSTIVKKHRTRFQMLECENCKAQVAYDDSVEFEVLNSYEKRTEKTENGRTHVSQTIYVELGVVCNCQQCGEKKLFKCEFIKEKWVDGNRRYQKENEELIKGFFDGTILPV